MNTMDNKDSNREPISAQESLSANNSPVPTQASPISTSQVVQSYTDPSYSEPPKHNGKKLGLIIACIVIVILLGGAGAYVLFAGNKTDSKVKTQSQNAKSVKNTPPNTSQSSQSVPVTAQTPKVLPAYPDYVQTAFVNNCVSLGNKAPSCTCNINFIQQHYTLDQYNAISKDPNSRAYEDMVASAFDNYDCT
ncbi:MAG TPA: hypothetical protein VH234_01890 [Candidatus Saccharimonadales bacterium]|jgi:hypothetical protein|nr:hypothetical protein [Candidatus Saccharimonadales bacterium]